MYSTVVINNMSIDCKEYVSVRGIRPETLVDRRLYLVCKNSCGVHRRNKRVAAELGADAAVIDSTKRCIQAVNVFGGKIQLIVQL